MPLVAAVVAAVCGGLAWYQEEGEIDSSPADCRRERRKKTNKISRASIGPFDSPTCAMGRPRGRPQLSLPLRG